MLKRKISAKDYGRSMTEMLGVLAIIGILSITALMGYNYAVTKHKANTTINDLNQFVIIVTQQMLKGQRSLDLSEARNKTSLGYPATAYILADTNYFEIALANVSSQVCKQILYEKISEVLAIKVNGLANVGDTRICETDDENSLVDMVFQYAADLDGAQLPFGTCKTDSDCLGDCAKCNAQGLCVSRCGADERCTTDKENGVKVCCPSNRISGPYCCPSTLNGWCCDDNQQNCCPWHKPLRDKNGTCYACDDQTYVDATGVQENCNICSEREVIDNNCVVKCPVATPLRGINGQCFSCAEEKPVEMKKPWDYCKSACPNREANGLQDHYCSLPCGEGYYFDKPLSDIGGKCYDCDERKLVDVRFITHDGCEVCSNRQLIEKLCALECPSDKPVRDWDGHCRACEENEPFYFNGYSPLAQACVSVCPKRVQNGNYNSACSYDLCGHGIFKDKPLTGYNGVCYSCDESSNVNVVNVSHEGCDMCDNRYLSGAYCLLDCPSDKPVRDINGTCRSCYDTESFHFKGHTDFMQACLSKCPNRVKNGDGDTACSYDLCGQGIFKDKPLTSYEGKCYAFEEPANINVRQVTHEGCDQCTNRLLYNEMCVPKCPDEAPLRGRNGKCYPCDTQERVNVLAMTDACFSCPDERRLEGNYCVLK